MGALDYCGTISASGVPAGLLGAASMLHQFVVSGGWITWVVLVPLSMVTLALAIHHLFVIRRSNQMPHGLARALASAARHGRAREILEITRDDETMMGQAVHAAVSQLGEEPDTALTAMEEAVEERAGRLMRRIEYLNVIGNVSPMIGLLGTVVGMIQAFNRIYAAGGGVPEASKLVGDIAIALVNTFWGLLIAIPALSAHAFFRNRIDAFAVDCVKFCDSLVAALGSTRTKPDEVAGKPAGTPGLP
jgi:biopolymer transport protein ExbB